MELTVNVELSHQMNRKDTDAHRDRETKKALMRTHTISMILAACCVFNISFYDCTRERSVQFKLIIW